MSDSTRNDAAGCALDALSLPERRAIDLAAATDAELSREIESMRRVAGIFGTAVPAKQPPASLRERIMADAARAGASRAPTEAVEKSGRESRLMRTLPWLALAASLGGVAVLYRSLESARAENVALAESSRDLQSMLAANDSLLSTILGPDVRSARLVSSGTPPGATLWFNPGSRRLVLAAWRLAPAPAGRTYQLWAIAGGAPVSLGTFNSEPGGDVRATFEVPVGVEIVTGAVTEEPAGGSPQPTSAPFLVGSVPAGG
ncbi:MAG: anti-sigma factor [Gemmatimonadota bacterium]